MMAQKLAREIGLGVGISSGANFLGALKVQNQMGGKATLVTVFPDDNKKYLSTDLLQAEPVQDHFLAPDVKLLGFRAFKRVCYTCWDSTNDRESAPAELKEVLSRVLSSTD
jgi:cysteine synthase A